ncbi:hypothetical protein BOX15_Mlig020898g1, partial [Macrostomum lignano]
NKADMLSSNIEESTENIEPAVIIMTIYSALNLPVPVDETTVKKKAKWQVTCYQGEKLKFSSRSVSDASGNPKWEITEAIELGESQQPLTLRLLSRGRLLGQAELPLSLVPSSEDAALPTDAALLPLPGANGVGRAVLRYRCWVAATRRRKLESRGARSGAQGRRQSAPAVRFVWRRLGRRHDTTKTPDDDKDIDEGVEEDEVDDALSPLPSKGGVAGVGEVNGRLAAVVSSGDEAGSSSSSSEADGISKKPPKPPRQLLELRIDGLRSELESVRRDSAQLLARLRQAEAAATAAELRVTEAEAKSSALSADRQERVRDLTQFIDRLVARLMDSGLEHLLERQQHSGSRLVQQ